jgi:hypothetical protein
LDLCSLYRNTPANAKSFAYSTNFFNTLPSRAIPLRMFSSLALPEILIATGLSITITGYFAHCGFSMKA